jgi:hypothetical protein
MKLHAVPGFTALALAMTPLTGAAQQAPPATSAPAATPAPAEAEKPAARRARSAPKPSRHVFSLMAGSWSGGGTISLSSGDRERLRCRAHHSAGQGGTSLSLSIRCASDSYRFELTSNVVERRGRIFGRWSEAANGVSGTISGHASGNRVRALASSDSFTAGISVATSGNRQSVSITPRGTFISGVHISLSRR